MKLIKDTCEFHIEEETAVAIGKFDGLHLGHRLLLEQLFAAKKRGLKTAVFTFDPSPAVFFGKETAGELLTREEKRDCFARIGIDYLVEYPFNARTAAVKPEAYVRDFLLGNMHAKLIAAGEDVSFGDKGLGDASLLKSVAKACGCEVCIIPKLCHNGREISSSYVREEVQRGNMELAGELLGEPFFVSGTVLKGNKIGRKLGMPTLNLIPDESKLLPPAGVYFSTTLVGEKSYRGVTNIGLRPTIKEEAKRLGVETYLFDFAKEIYGKNIYVNLLSFSRPERAFDGLERLKAAIEQDVKDAKNYFGME